MSAWVVPHKKNPTEIVVFGACPRCEHQTRSTHAIREVITGAAQPKTLEAQNLPTPQPSAVGQRLTAQCRCGYNHPGHPDTELTCGAPYSIVVSWEPDGEGREATVTASPTPTTVLELEEERELQAAQKTELSDVRKAAENWRTGLAGLLAVLTAFFIIKGKESIDDIAHDWVKWVLGIVLVSAGAIAVFGAYKAIRAAYGVPRDELIRKGMKDYGTVSAWRHAYARAAVDDLRWAKVATISSLVLLALATVITWAAPGPPPPAFVNAQFAAGGEGETAAICGELIHADSDEVLIEVRDGDVRRFSLPNIRSFSVVDECK
jgi:hypothetical protein